MWWNDGNESIDDWILNQWPKNERGLEQAELALNIQRSLNEVEWNECVDPMMELLIDLDKISENGRNIYEWNQINQSILEIDFDRTYSNESIGRLTVWRFGISKYHQYSMIRNTFQCHWTRITETTPFRINGFKLRQIYWNHLESHQSYLSMLTKMKNHFFHEVPIDRV